MPPRKDTIVKIELLAQIAIITHYGRGCAK
jgi:hypothetical protein